MDGWTDGRTDGRTHGKDGCAGGCTDGRTGGPTGGRTYGRGIMFGNCAVLKDAMSKKKKALHYSDGIDNCQGIRVTIKLQ